MSEPKSVLTEGPISGKPLVSVSVFTYNHEKYIRQCLNGILMQKVTFPYEILIHDDASPDGTADIIREYEAMYPEVIKPIYQTENQYSQGVDVSRFNFDRAWGNYVALCEGDDYWTDPNKLQMQVDFLDKHPEYVGTAHNVRVVDGTGKVIKYSRLHWEKEFSDHIYTLRDFELFRIPSQAGSFVFRNIFQSLDPVAKHKYYECKANGDEKISLLQVMFGDVYFFSETMSAYRYVVSDTSSWSASVYKKNISHNTYCRWVTIAKYAEDVFHIHIDTKEYWIHALTESALHLISKPTWDNYGIFSRILKESQSKKLSYLLYFFLRLPHYIYLLLMQIYKGVRRSLV